MGESTEKRKERKEEEKERAGGGERKEERQGCICKLTDRRNTYGE